MHTTHNTPTEKTWQKLETAIREIHNQNASGLSYEELYRYVSRSSLCRRCEDKDPNCSKHAAAY